MNQIYKFSDPTSGCTHYILSKEIKKNLKYLDYLCRNYIKNPDKEKNVNSPLVRYLIESKKPFTEIMMDLVFESEDRTEAEQKLAEFKVETQVKPNEEQVEVSVEQVEPVSAQPAVEESVAVVQETPVATPKKRGRKKKIVQEDVIA